jgi:hypothetical protein
VAGRFNRVVAVCGVTADGTPYYRPGLHRHMQGCFGPPAKMTTAVAAYTPNTPWALMGCGAVVGFGSGTSSATPQVAAAAALWLQAVKSPPGVAPWQRVEAVRQALFTSAGPSGPGSDTYFGRGVLNALAALGEPFRSDLPISPPDEVGFPWLRVADLLESVPGGSEQMYEVEALQVFLQTPALQDLTGGADPMSDRLSPADAKRLVEAMGRSPMISNALRSHLADVARRL